MPMRVLAAFSRYDIYRKPNTGMFDEIKEIYSSKGIQIDMAKSVYVGDAAGRMAIVLKKKDHGDTDFKLALNVGLRFVTPEVSRARV